MAVEVLGNTIRVPQGDTGAVKFLVDEGKVSGEDKGVFTLARRDGTPILRKLIEPNESDNAFHMMLTHEDTKLKPDAYEWSFRVVRGGVFDASGKLVETQGQHTAILSGRMSVLAVAGGVR